MGPITLYVYERTPEPSATSTVVEDRLRLVPLRQRCGVAGCMGSPRARLEQCVGRLADELVDFVGGDDENPLADVGLIFLKIQGAGFIECSVRVLKPTQPFDINDLWERRLRHQLGNRYDAKAGAFDWDYRYGDRGEGRAD